MTEFIRTGPSSFTCSAGSKPGLSYVLGVTGRANGGVSIQCTCEGSMRRGPDTCRHARELREWLNEQGLGNLVLT